MPNISPLLWLSLFKADFYQNLLNQQNLRENSGNCYGVCTSQ